jgi:methyl-accepting chemotaxis protein
MLQWLRNSFSILYCRAILRRQRTQEERMAQIIRLLQTLAHSNERIGRGMDQLHEKLQQIEGTINEVSDGLGMLSTSLTASFNELQSDVQSLLNAIGQPGNQVPPEVAAIVDRISSKLAETQTHVGALGAVAADLAQLGEDTISPADAQPGEPVEEPSDGGPVV